VGAVGSRCGGSVPGSPSLCFFQLCWLLVPVPACGSAAGCWGPPTHSLGVLEAGEPSRLLPVACDEQGSALLPGRGEGAEHGAGDPRLPPTLRCLGIPGSPDSSGQPGSGRPRRRGPVSVQPLRPWRAGTRLAGAGGSTGRAPEVRLLPAKQSAVEIKLGCRVPEG